MNEYLKILQISKKIQTRHHDSQECHGRQALLQSETLYALKLLWLTYSLPILYPPVFGSHLP